MATLECPEVGVAACSGCGEKPARSRGLCSRCLSREHRRATVGDCPGCGKRRSLPVRGLCRTCSPKVRGDFRTRPDARLRRPGPDDAELAAAIRDDFERVVLPLVLRRVRRRLWHSRRHLLDDAAQEVAALAWTGALRVAVTGRNVAQLAGWLASTAFRQWAAGYRVCGGESCDDALSDRARVTGRRGVVPFDAGEDGGFCPAEFVRDLRYGTVPDRAALHIDLRDWLDGLGPTSRGVVNRLADGNTVQETATALGVSYQGVIHIRGRLRDSWARFFRD